ncbi:delta fatty acid desaturase [Saccharomonospora sp. CUA-673]|uniref:fatty acid desaturase family protein n=1 Tax=Saccharomonospora sp. CUA-673 TaxID=1904969 RepID=UPI0009610616|nr:acyl-CoA desaturase [Saccharomonospora sp. CUA-673]OLT47032.1 delta fatty acid desaturase [Saccharomonospora sp. CUA-673]
MTSSTAETSDVRRGSDFAVLSKRIAAAGLFARRPGYYTVRVGILAALYGGGLAAFVALGDTWWQLLLAAFFAVVFAQVALVAHDVAHRQVFRTRRASTAVGLVVGNLAIGLSYGWWMDKHTRHHAHPNHEERDPDVAPDILVWSREQAEEATGVPRAIGRWQALLFFPLLTLEGFNLHVASVRALANRRLKHRVLEATLLAVHVAAYLGALLLVLSPLKALVFLLVHQALWGVYMGSAFAPGHKGMPTLKEGESLDFLRRQVLTTRNVRGGIVVDNVMGGLNYQIEHHLFPSLPMPHLRQAQPIVRDYCAEIGVPYHETGLLESWREALGHLHRVGEPIRG